MKILLLGASGRTGRHILNVAVDAGYELNCIVRNPDKIKSDSPLVHIIKGDPLDLTILEQGMKGCAAIINVLNISRTSDFPWSGLRTPKTYISDVISGNLHLAQQFHIKRLISCSAWGVSDSRAEIPGWFRWFIDNSNIGVAYADHQRQEELIFKSDMDWTIVRPVGLINTSKKQKVIESYKNSPKPSLTIGRLTLAHYIVDAIADEKLIEKIPVVSSPIF